MPKISLLILSVVVSVSAFCAESSNQFVYYDLSEAVSNEVIKSVIKDEVGYLWFATDEGLLKYNGVSSQNYQDGLRSNYVKHFLNTQDGRLVALDDIGLNEVIVDGESVEIVPFQWGSQLYDFDFNYPKSIYQDNDGNIWVGEASSVVRINENGYKRFNLGVNFQSISYHRTFQFQEDAFGTLWIAPYKGSLLKYNPQADQLEEVEIELPVTDVSGFTVLNGDYLMLGGKEGIFQIKVDSDQQLLSSELIDKVDNVLALECINEIVFVGTWDQGLLQYDYKKKEMKPVSAVDFNDIVDFYLDPETSDIWVVGSENVGLISFSVIHPMNPVGSVRIESVSQDHDKFYYSIGQEIRLYDPAEAKVTRLLQTKSNFFNKIVAKNDVLWIGDSFGAILKYNVRGGSIILLKDSTGTAIKHSYMDYAANKWFCGNLDYVVKVKGYTDEVSTYPVRNSNVLKQAPDGAIYCGSSDPKGPLSRYDEMNDQFEALAISIDFELSSPMSIEDMSFVRPDSIWLITNYGILAGNPLTGQFSKVLIPDVTIDESYKAITIQDEIIWISGNSGLYAYNGDEVLMFNTRNGLPSKLLNWRGLDRLDGGVMISTAKGLVKVNSDKVQFENTPAPIILGMKVSNEPFIPENDQDISIPYEGSLELEFTTLTYPGKQIMYQSRILEISDSWSAATSNRQLSYIGFSEGSYTIQIRSREVGAMWSEPVEMKFTVPEPWYKTFWAKLLMLLLVAIMVVAAIRIYNYNLILQKRRFKSIIEERTRLINEQKNEIIAHKNRIIEQKEELLAKTESVHKSQQALQEADVNFLHLKEKQLLDQIDYKNKQITTHTLHIIQKNETLKDLKDRLDKHLKSPTKTSAQEIRKSLRVIDDSYRMDKDWEDFKLYFEQIYTGFYAKLKVNCPALTTQELRHCALIRLNLSVNECATILGISPESVKVSRSRIRKKMNLETGQNLADFILSI